MKTVLFVCLWCVCLWCVCLCVCVCVCVFVSYIDNQNKFPQSLTCIFRIYANAQRYIQVPRNTVQNILQTIVFKSTYSYFHYIIICFYFTWIEILLIPLSVYHMYAWCPQRSEEDIGFLKLELEVDYELLLRC